MNGSHFLCFADGHGESVKVPDVLCVFANGTIGGEFAHACGVEDGHACPAVFVTVGVAGLFLCLKVGAVVGEHEEWVVREEALRESVEAGGGVWGEVAGIKPVDDFAEFLVGFINLAWVVARSPKGTDFFDVVAEYEDVVRADFLEDFDVCAIECAKGNGAVEGEFHIAGAAGLLASCGDLLGDVGGRDDLFGKCDAVVREEGDLEFVLDTRVAVDEGCGGVDGVDDVLGEDVARGGFCAENEDARLDVEGRVVEQAAVEC